MVLGKLRGNFSGFKRRRDVRQLERLALSNKETTDSREIKAFSIINKRRAIK